jgi:aspartyl-tRNA(Asn)/glutamyl-tRNA(Gln) amidotransferase subunit A
MSMADYAYLTLADAAVQIRRKEISPVEYLRALLERIDTYDAHYDAFLRQTPDMAMRQARQAETEIMAGNWRGPLHGVPYGLKDIIDVAGIPTTAHSKILADNLARTDAVVAQRLKAAGGVLVGKLATHEFAMGGPSFDLPWPPARNAWNRAHFSGGSSSGSGVAVAAGFVPAALGTDTGGLDVRHHWDETDLWTGQPTRRHPAVLCPRSCGSHDADGDRQRPRAQHHCRA